MDTSSFDTAITDFYKEVYGVEYISNSYLTYEFDGDLYRFLYKIQLNQVNKPITISGQFATLDEFTTFTINELKTRRFPTVDYFNLVNQAPMKTIV